MYELSGVEEHKAKYTSPDIYACTDIPQTTIKYLNLDRYYCATYINPKRIMNRTRTRLMVIENNVSENLFEKKIYSLYLIFNYILRS